MKYKAFCLLLLWSLTSHVALAQAPPLVGQAFDNFKKWGIPIAPRNVTCNTPPMLIIPKDYRGCPGAPLDPKFIGLASAHPGEPGCLQPDITYRDTTLTQGTCGDIHLLRIWIATDPVQPQLFNRDTQDILLIDTIAPQFSFCPSDITVVAPVHKCEVSAVWQRPVVTDNCYQLLLVTNHYPGEVFPAGKTKVMYTAEDQCGNIDSCTFFVTVLSNCCKEVPIVYCPDDYFGCPGDSTSPKKTKFATGLAGSADCNDPLISYRDEVLSSATCHTLIHRTWYATDPLQPALKDSCVQRIVLRDSIPPHFEACPNDITVASNANCEAIVHWTPPKAVDNCGIQTVQQSQMPGDTFPLGRTTVTYTATDHCGHTATCSFVVTVDKQCCTTAPTLKIPDDYTGCPGAPVTPDITGKATAQPGEPTCASPTLSYRDSVLDIGPCAGQLSIIRKWTAQDPDHPDLRTNDVQRIILRDSIPPHFEACPNDITVASNANCEAIVHWTPPKAVDNCGIQTVQQSHMPGDTFPLGRTTVTYTATDRCGHTATCSFVVTVTDNCCVDPPILTLPSDYSGCPGTPLTTDIAGRAVAEAGSVHCGNPLVTFRDSILRIGPCTGAITVQRVWRAEDPDKKNLYSEGIQTLTLIDTIPPVITHCPKDTVLIPYSNCEAYLDWSPPTVQDNCAPNITVHSNYQPGDLFPAGETTVTYTAEDNCGNTSTCSFVVTVADKSISIVCPGDITRVAPYSEGGTVVEFPEPEAQLCNTCLTDTVINRFMYMGTFRGHKYFCSRFQMRWNEAQEMAERLGGYLAVIEDEKENVYLSKKLMGTPAYIGLTDEAREGHFRWANGSPLHYTHWAPGEPDDLNRAQDYVELYPNGEWKDQYMMRPREFIVEIPCYDVELLGPIQQGDFLVCGDYEVEYALHAIGGASDTCSYSMHIECPMWMNYCPAQGLSADRTWIESIDVDGQVFRTGNNGGYWAEQNKIIGMDIHAPHTMDVIAGGAGANVYWKAWVDYDRDGDFEYKEVIGSGSHASGMSFNFTVPKGTSLGLAALRIILAYGKMPSDACREVGYGEVEDYYLYLTSSAKQSGLRETGANTVSNDVQISIFPNPGRRTCQLSGWSGSADLSIYDRTGRRVQTLHNIDSRGALLDVSEWKAGIYHVVLNTEAEGTIVKKLVVLQ